jgi:hypothetical protein
MISAIRPSGYRNGRDKDPHAGDVDGLTAKDSDRRYLLDVQKLPVALRFCCEPFRNRGGADSSDRRLRYPLLQDVGLDDGFQCFRQPLVTLGSQMDP